MADPTPTPIPTPTLPMPPQPIGNQISTTVTDLVKTEQDATALYHAYKSGGKEGAIALMSSLWGDLEEDVDNVLKIAPIAKSGYKTTEFWLVIGYILLNMFGPKLGIQLPPIGDDMTIGGLLATYVGGRVLTKTKSTTTTKE